MMKYIMSQNTILEE
jgi:hypothetical protein